MLLKTLILLPLLVLNAEAKSPLVVYGNDDRSEVFEKPQWLERAKSVAALVDNSHLKKENFTHYKLELKTLKEEHRLCEDVRFAEQRVLADCSGFLVAPDVIMTAGHCFEDPFTCQNSSWVFDYQLDPTLKNPDSIDKDSVYQCSRVLHQSYREGRYDFALIKLDRPTERKPLALLPPGASAKAGDPLAMLGFPNGIPMKLTDGGKVLSVQEEGILVTDLDAFNANSGSPIFNEKTGVVVGIMISGMQDYLYWAPKRCSYLNELSALGAQEKFTGVGVVPRNF